jgi:hypothetical protein
VGCLRLLGAYSNFTEKKSDDIVLFSSDDFELGGSQGYEIERQGFFPLDDLPADVSPGTRRRREEYLRGEGLSASGAW